MLLVWLHIFSPPTNSVRRHSHCACICAKLILIRDVFSKANLSIAADFTLPAVSLMAEPDLESEAWHWSLHLPPSSHVTFSKTSLTFCKPKLQRTSSVGCKWQACRRCSVNLGVHSHTLPKSRASTG